MRRPTIIIAALAFVLPSAAGAATVEECNQDRRACDIAAAEAYDRCQADANIQATREGGDDEDKILEILTPLLEDCKADNQSRVDICLTQQGACLETASD